MLDSTSMKAVRLVRLGKPLEDAEVSLPDIGASEVLVRVAACGICHSDAHYRAGISPIESLPVTLGHEVAGRVETVGRDVHHVSSGDRVYVHYLVSCGCCDFCRRGHEQFCSKGQMIGKHRDGGYAEFIKVPGRNVFLLPDGIPFDATAEDPVEQIREATDGKGVDVSIELVGSAITMGQAVRCLAVFGRAALVGLTAESLSVLPYTEVINKEAEIIGVSDHLATELPLLMQFARNGKLCFPEGTLRLVGLDATQINAALDEVAKSSDHIRSVIAL